MNKYILLLVLISGFLSGYLIGDYRGKDAREALKKAIETGKTLESEREATLTRLKTELDAINDKHRSELDAIRKNNAFKVSEWQRSRKGLNGEIRDSTARLTDIEARLKSLATQRDAASGSEKAALDLEIARQQKERADLQREIEGNSCLQAQVPHGVFNALNEAKSAGGK